MSVGCPTVVRRTSKRRPEVVRRLSARHIFTIYQDCVRADAGAKVRSAKCKVHYICKVVHVRTMPASWYGSSWMFGRCLSDARPTYASWYGSNGCPVDVCFVVWLNVDVLTMFGGCPLDVKRMSCWCSLDAQSMYASWYGSTWMSSGYQVDVCFVVWLNVDVHPMSRRMYDGCSSDVCFVVWLIVDVQPMSRRCPGDVRLMFDGCHSGVRWLSSRCPADDRG